MLTARGSGSWLLALRERQRWAAGAVQQLEVELLFPSVAAGGAGLGPRQPAPTPNEASLHRRRGRVRRAELCIEQPALNEALAAQLQRRGGELPSRNGPAIHFDLVRARIDGTEPMAGMLLLFRCRRGAVEPDDGPLWGTARLTLRRLPQGAADLVLGLSEVRVYGRTRTAAPLIGHALLQLVGSVLLALAPTELPPVTLLSGQPPLGLQPLSTPALSELRVELLHDALLALMPVAGYRVADPSTAPLCEVEGMAGRIVLRYAADGQRGGLSYADLDERPRSNPVVEPAGVVLGAPLPEALRIGDFLLAGGDTAAALAAYELLDGSSALSVVARRRRLQVLCTASVRHPQAIALAEAELSASPTAAAALIALAAIAEDEGQLHSAARRYLALGADVLSHSVERSAAFFIAARFLAKSDPAAARAALAAAESLLSPGGPEQPLLDAVRAVRHPESHPVAAVPAVRPPSVTPATVDSDATPLPPPVASATLLRDAALATVGDERAAQLEAALQLYPDDLELLRLRAELEAPAQALQRISSVLGASPLPPPAVASADEPLRHLLIFAAQLAAQLGDLERSRSLLEQAGGHPEVLHARTQLDWPELMQARPQSESDLLPVLQELQQSGAARPEELRGLARLLTARGHYNEALTVQQQADGNPDELLASLESAGRFAELHAALEVHASRRPESASLLYQQSATVAEYQLFDLRLAAAAWQQAAEAAIAEQRLGDAGLFLFQAGRLWAEQKEPARAYPALVRSVEMGGGGLPRVTVLLAEVAYALGDFDAASLYYRQALDGGQIDAAARGQAYLRIADAAHGHADATTEEQALARAVEAGSGGDAWPRLATLFRSQGAGERLGAALLSWADYESGEKRVALLREAATLVKPQLLPRIDDELVRAEADDEAVRDRVQERLTEQGAQAALTESLRRDVERSQGPRRRQLAKRLVELALKRSAYSDAVNGWLALLEEAPEPLPDGELQEALNFWNTLQRVRAGRELGKSELSALREQIIERGQLLSRWQAMKDQAEPASGAVSREARAERQQRLRLAAAIAEVIGYDEAAARSYLRLCAELPTDGGVLSQLRRVLRSLAQGGRAAEALALVDAELQRLGPAAARAFGLRVALAELLLFQNRNAEAMGQLELVLLRTSQFAPAHALLGMLLGTAEKADEVQRGLEHLLYATYATDVDGAEAAECALMAADLLASAGVTDPIDLTTLRESGPPRPSYTERATDGTFVAVPTDFLAAASKSGEELEPPPPRLVLPPQIGPVELLLHAAALLPGDPRPLEGLLGLSWARGDYRQALDCCDRLLALPEVASDAGERSRLQIEKAHVLLRVDRAADAELLLRESLQSGPVSAAALRALRQIVKERGQLPAALELLQRELKLITDEGPVRLVPGQTLLDGVPGLWLELGDLQSQLGHPAPALAAWRRAGYLGLAEGFVRLAEGLVQEPSGAVDWLTAADAAGRAAALTPELSRGPLLLRAAELAVRADDELRARDLLAQAVAGGGESGALASEQLRQLDGGPEPERRLQTLERRLKQSVAGLERLEILRRLVLLCAELYERSAMVLHANALLREAPGDPLALCALAEDAIERGQPDQAVAKLEQAAAIPPSYPRPTRLLTCLGEVYERRGDGVAAESAYQRLFDAGERIGDGSAVEVAIEGLVRLREEQGDAAAALRLLRRRLGFLPADADAARVTLQLRMSDLALTLGDLPAARGYLDGVLDENPAQKSALVKLLEVHKRLGDRAEAQRTLDRLIDLAMTPGERAEWLFARAELGERDGADPQVAAEHYRQVLTHSPVHARALRRLLALAARQADGPGVAKAAAALSKAGATLGEVRLLAGLGLLLDGTTTTAETPPLLRQAAAEDLATALLELGAGLPLDREPPELEGPLSGAVRALGGNDAALVAALRSKLQSPAGFEPRAALLLGRLWERRGLRAQVLYLAPLSYLWPGSRFDRTLDELGAQPLSELALEAALLAVRPLPAEQAPWLVVLGLLGRHLLGLQLAPLPSRAVLSAEWENRLAELGHMVGLARLEVALVDKLDGAPARCEPTRPPRLRLLAALCDDESQARFAALRALHLLRAGIPLGERDGPAGLAALIRAAAALWLEGESEVPRVEELESQHPAEAEWLATLRALALHPDHAPGAQYEARAESAALIHCVTRLGSEPQCLAVLWPALVATAELQASARALGQLGDLRAALRVVGRPRTGDDSTEQRLAALRRAPLAELLVVATKLYDEPARPIS